MLNPAKKAKANGVVANIVASDTFFEALGVQNQPIARPAMPPRPRRSNTLPKVVGVISVCGASPKNCRIK